MHRIDSSTATPDNRFTEGDPTIPVPATTVTDDWLNAVQEELIAILAAANITPDKANNAQVLAAIQRLIADKTGIAKVGINGLVNPDGTTITIGNDGILSAVAAGAATATKDGISAGIVAFAADNADPARRDIAATPAMVREYLSQFLNPSQSWQSFTVPSQRNVGVTYTNTSGSNIFVWASLYAPTAPACFEVFLDGAQVGRARQATAAGVTIYFLVRPGGSYRITVGESSTTVHPTGSGTTDSWWAEYR